MRAGIAVKTMLMIGDLRCSPDTLADVSFTRQEAS